MRRTWRARATTPASPATSKSSPRIRISSSSRYCSRRPAAPSSAPAPSSTGRSAAAGSSEQDASMADKDKNHDKDHQKKLKTKAYEKELTRLQGKLCILQEYVKAKGLRAIVVFEGRDAAGKGGTIKALTERVSPRVFRLIALPAPSDREKTQMYMQRYMQHFPAAGEIVIFDRSWYNRAGVERVMGFVGEQQYQRFLQLCPVFEGYIVEAGITLIKIWLEVSMDEQENRFAARVDDPLRQWKLSPMDVESYTRWYEYG